MTVRQQKALQRYVDSLRPMLGLRDWEVTVKGEGALERDTSVAECRTVIGCRSATVRFCEEFFTHEPAYQRETIIHELLHCVFSAPQDQVRYILPDYLPGKSGEIFRDVWFHGHEYAIDGLAVALGPLFPLPELPR